MRRLRFLAVLVAILSLTLPTSATTNLSLGTSTASAAVAPTVTIHGATTTIRPNQPVPPGAASAELTAAKNEFESFQVAIANTGATDLTGVTVSLSAPLQGAGGTIPASSVTIYREAYYNVVTPSDADLGGATGPFPDALIPAVDPFLGEARNAFPVTVPAGRNQAVWVDVLAPQGQQAGVYEGALTVSGAGFSVNVPVRLTVLNFALPSTSSLRNAFGMAVNEPCSPAVHNCAGEAKWAMNALYTRAALENRVTLEYAAPDVPRAGTASNTYFRRHLLPLINGSSPQLRLPGAQVTDIMVQDWCLNTAWFPNCMGDWKAEGVASGFVERISFYPCDEPGRNATKWNGCATSYDAATRQWNSVAPNIELPMATTARIQDVDWAKTYDPGDGTRPFANVASGLDTLVPVVQHVDGRPQGHQYPGPYTYSNQRTTYNAFLGVPTHHLWMYTSCESFSCADGGGGQYVGWPGYAIDQPASESRAMGWLAFTYDVTGELYFQTVKQLGAAWTNQYSEGGNGDGTLFYPGKTSVIGGTRDIPIESIRLKRIRDGREDYEYLKFLKDRGKGARALEISTGLFPTLYDTDKTQTALDGARNSLIAEIKALVDPAGAYRVEDWLGCGGGYNSGSWDDAGNLYVPCGNPSTIRVYDAAGNKIRDIPLNLFVTDVAPSPDGQFLYAARGNAEPVRLSRQADGSYALDPNWHLAQYIHADGGAYAPKGHFVATDGAGNVYLADGAWANNTTVIKYRADGSFLTRFGEVVYTGADPRSWTAGYFHWMLTGLAVSRDGGKVYTTEVGNNRVQRFDRQADGSYKHGWMFGGNPQNTPDRSVSSCNFTGWEGKFAAPYDVALDEAGDLYVMNTTCHQVLKFTAAGAYIAGAKLGADPSPRPHGFAVSKDGNRVYVGQSGKLWRRDATPAPQITSLNPSSATAGGAGFTLTVNGSNFVSGSKVRWNGSDRATTFVSGAQLTAAIPASDIAAAGTATVTVFNPAPGGGTSNGQTFTINSTPSTADLEVTGVTVSPAAITVGDNVTYSVAVRNNGPSSVRPVSLDFTLPQGARWLPRGAGQTGGCMQHPDDPAWINCALALDAGAAATVKVVAAPTRAGAQTVRVAAAYMHDTNPANNSGSATYTAAGKNCTIVGAPTDAGWTGNESFTGTAGADVICALDGNDTIKAAAGNDTVYGGSGNDTLYGGPGDDTLSGGTGYDRVSYSDAPEAVGLSLTNHDAWELDRGVNTVGYDQFAADIERAEGSAYNDMLSGDALANTLLGHGGNDTINAYGGNDVVLGGGGDDSLNGNTGYDRISFEGATAAVAVNLGTSGVTPGPGKAAGQGTDSFTGFEHVTGTAYADTLYGSAYANSLYGARGNDQLWGMGGNDALYGQDNDDTLRGGDGDDRLDGGLNTDTCYQDAFVNPAPRYSCEINP